VRLRFIFRPPRSVWTLPGTTALRSVASLRAARGLVHGCMSSHAPLGGGLVLDPRDRVVTLPGTTALRSVASLRAARGLVHGCMGSHAPLGGGLVLDPRDRVVTLPGTTASRSVASLCDARGPGLVLDPRDPFGLCPARPLRGRSRRLATLGGQGWFWTPAIGLDSARHDRFAVGRVAARRSGVSSRQRGFTRPPWRGAGLARGGFGEGEGLVRERVWRLGGRDFSFGGLL
jgi:hypothetical protein